MENRKLNKAEANKSFILIVDDDPDLTCILSDLLTEYGYQTQSAANGEEAYQYLERKAYELIILDINLPEENGFEICRNIRRVSQVPIIFASARSSENDKINGLDIGADDYLPKPYSLKEMLSRVNALLRRSKGFREEAAVIRIADLEIREGERRVCKKDRDIALSLKEFDLLLYMAQHKNTIITKETLLKEVWGMFSEAEIATVAVHIRWLREKIEDDPGKPVLIRTSWGVGYGLFE